MIYKIHIQCIFSKSFAIWLKTQKLAHIIDKGKEKYVNVACVESSESVSLDPRGCSD